MRWVQDHREYTVEEIFQYISDCPIICIGSDSQRHGLDVKYSTVILCEKPNTTSGPMYWYWNQRIVYDTLTLRERIFKECNRSMEVAFWLQKKFPNKKIEVHVDVSTDPRHASSRYLMETKGFIQGCGFDFKCKPESWVASTVADWHVK